MEPNNEENLNSQMEGQENPDSSNEEPTEEATVPEENDEQPEEGEKYTENERKLYTRAKKAEEEGKSIKSHLEKKGYKWENGELVEIGKEPEAPSETTDEVTLSRLEVRGVMEQEDQEYVLRFAKAEGISPIEALRDDIVQDRLKANKRKRDSENATPRGNNRAGNTEDEVDTWVRKYKKDGSLPENNPALTSKILDKLAKGA